MRLHHRHPGARRHPAGDPADGRVFRRGLFERGQVVGGEADGVFPVHDDGQVVAAEDDRHHRERFVGAEAGTRPDPRQRHPERPFGRGVHRHRERPQHRRVVVIGSGLGVLVEFQEHLPEAAEKPRADVTDEQWAEGVRKHFSGRIIVGKDLMEI